MKKMKAVDNIVTLVFILALIVIYFFWGCHLDLYVTILAGIVIAVATMTSYVQYKRIKKLMPEENNE